MKRFMTFILAIVLLLSASSISFAETSDSSYNEYFSKERAFSVNDDTYEYSTYFFSNEEDNGYLYSHNVDTDEKALVFAQNVTEHYLWDEHLYCVVNGKNIVKITVSGQNPETVLTTNGNISQLYVNDDIIYYLMDNSIYRYHRASQTTDRIVQDDYIYFFYPYSNYVVEWGDGSGNQDVNRLDTNTQEITVSKQYEFLVVPEIVTRAASSSSVHGTTLPYGSSYAAGRYFNESGTSPCPCHPNSAACPYLTSNKSCDSCKSVNGSWQCLAFAHQMHKQIWGSYGTKNTKSYTISSTANARAAFWNLPSGTHVRASRNTTKSEQHSFIIADVSNTGATLYEANWESGCKITYTFVSFQTLASRYKSIDYTYDAQHSFRSLYSFDETMHWHPCSTSGCNGKSGIGTHSLKENSSGTLVCTVCGYDSGVSASSLEASLS